jgi:hypothetical protein
MEEHIKNALKTKINNSLKIQYDKIIKECFDDINNQIIKKGVENLNDEEIFETNNGMKFLIKFNRKEENNSEEESKSMGLFPKKFPKVTINDVKDAVVIAGTISVMVN